MEKDKEKSDDPSDHYGGLDRKPEERMNTKKAVMQVSSICLKVAVVVLVILGIIYLGQTTYRYTHAVFSDQAYEEQPGKNVTITISEEVTVREISEILEEKGLIEDAGVFRIQMKMSDFDKTIEPGTYELNSSMTPEEIAEVLSGDE